MSNKLYKKKRKNGLLLGLAFPALALLGGSLFGVALYLNENHDSLYGDQSKTALVTKGGESTESTPADSTTPSTEDGTDKFTKEGVIEALTNSLKELSKAPSEGMTLKDRMDLLSSKGYEKGKIFTKEGWDKFIISDFMNTDSRGYTLTAQSTLSVINAIVESGNKELKAADVDLAGVVLLDKDVKAAYVPVDLFTNTPTNLSFELFYLDGKWKIQPYMLISQIAIRTMEQAVVTEAIEGNAKVGEESEATTNEDNKENNKANEKEQD